MKISSTLFEHMKKMEAIRPHVYDDATSKDVSDWSQLTGFPTIALGKKIEAAERAIYAAYLKGKAKLEGAALQKVIDETFKPREKKLTDAIKVPVTQSMFDALFSFSFNTGFGAKSFKNILAKVNAADYVGAQQALANGPSTSKGKSLPGLVARRKYESELFAAEGLSPAGAPLAGFQPSYGYPAGTHYGVSPVPAYGVSPVPAYGAVSGRTFGGGATILYVGTATLSSAVGWGIGGAILGAIVPKWNAKETAVTGAKIGAGIGLVGSSLVSLLAWKVASAAAAQK
jgi:GH24 family phage-related lysozyme (muramidase)